MIIREARKQDYPELRKIYLESRQQNFHWVNRSEMASEDFDRDTVEEQIIVAEDNSRIVGFSSLYLPENFIHNLFVHPSYTSKGVGGKLLHHALETMNKPIRLKCISENDRALKFYDNNGGKKVVEEGNPGEKYWVVVFE
ncbi:GNAT family N-acetyltransferase [Paenibacillus radicis (ex Gao et al. 2016)]|uniref:N-acetyltransferase GCN5 n=1 Tax=Paenibacillus radicis (ex Gao et al. 2016) TaxID=1737354 RepID=A0A917H2A9_9BACL|nr:GNAT family N-acetyltransferase [Paenibacillus radicis (ex Gao et al. 2016)]GGG64627.1 N-acetyltransferase GCN5 [Paenibacillus radicis (ex Gao et al. 2016)]